MKKKRFILVLDLETTGLASPILNSDGTSVNGASHYDVMEIAFILCDESMNELTRLQQTVEYNPENFCTKTRKFHEDNGYLAYHESKEKVSVSIAQVNAIQLIAKHVGELKEYSYDNEYEIILAGKSIWFDRAFLTEHMPILAAIISHQMIDVSSLKILLKMFRPNIKALSSVQSTHRALDDCEAALADLNALVSLVNLIPDIDCPVLSDWLLTVKSD